MRSTARRRKRADSKYERTIGGRFRTGKSKAKSRGFEWTLSLDQFKEVVAHNCYYCNDPNDATSGHGLDRIDSSLGYTPSNVVSCCKICNRSKGEMSLLEFYSWLKRTVKNIWPNKNF